MMLVELIQVEQNERTGTAVNWSAIRAELERKNADHYAHWREQGLCGDCGRKLPENVGDTCPFCGLDLLPF